MGELLFRNTVLIFIILLIALLSQNVFSDKFLQKFHQNDFKVRNLRLELTSFNKDYVNHFEVKVFKYNRSTTVHNITFNVKQDMKNTLAVIVQSYKFLSNEYRTFPLRFEISFCKAYNADVVGLLQSQKCSNIKECTSLKANTTYYICNFVIDESNLPPYLPNGNFMTELQLVNFNGTLAIINVYAEVYKPIPIPKK